MKRIVKISLWILVAYIGYTISNVMEISPYKDKATAFITLLKQDKPFEAQELISSKLQEYATIEDLKNIYIDNNLSKSQEIDWGEWEKEDENYTLNGSLILKNGKDIDLEFKFMPADDDIWISQVYIGDTKLKINSETFLK